MNRRQFLQTVVATTATFDALDLAASPQEAKYSDSPPATEHKPVSSFSIEGHTLLCAFPRGRETWKVYEDLRNREGSLTFLSSSGAALVLPKRLEAAFPEGQPYLGLNLKEICLANADLLADKLLEQGDPDESAVRQAAPPMSSNAGGGSDWRPRWDTFVGSIECNDTMPVYPIGSTRNYHPVQYFPELTQKSQPKRYDGLLGGWMPAVRKVFPEDENSWFEIVVFGDVKAKDRFIVQTWHRTTHVRNGVIQKVEYGYSYPSYTRRRQPPAKEEFYLNLLEFVEYWQRALHDITNITLPDESWSDMVRYAFVKELMVRPRGVYPKYGAVDRDYYGPEYDGFQDIFTMSLYANLECGRFQMASAVFDNYFTDFVDDKGMINMRGAETAQYGLTLLLVAIYYRYTRDSELLRKHRQKIEAMAVLLAELQDEALSLPEEDRGHGLVHGWCESDACLHPDPSVWWKPYFANSAFTIRGWRELAQTWENLQMPGAKSLTNDLRRRSDILHKALLSSIAANTHHNLKPAYIGPLPGTTLTFRESLAKEHPSEQGWTHRCYAELLQPDVLTEEQAHMVIDCMRAYGATTLGVVANVMPANPDDRAILGFISYGYAQQLLRLDRIEEYILFLYSHRYHDHSRGSWTAGEVSGITGSEALFCIPAQQTIPLIIRWMLVFENLQGDELYFGRAIPRSWIESKKPLSIQSAPTRWGRVSYELRWQGEDKLIATINMPETQLATPKVFVRFRVPKGRRIDRIEVNAVVVPSQQIHKETISFQSQPNSRVEVVAWLKS